MIKRYYKNQSSTTYYQITDRPAFLYDILVIRNAKGSISEHLYKEVNENTYNSIVWNNFHIDKEEFYTLQSQFTSSYKGYNRQNAKDNFKKEWTILLDLKKQASDKTIENVNANPGIDFTTELSNQYNISGVDQQRQVLQNIEATVSNSISLYDIYNEARAEANMEYCRSKGVMIIN